MALLHKVDIIAWSSVSDRVMPGTPPAQAKGDHSTIASVQHLSADTGAWVVAATRNGVETNPITKQQWWFEHFGGQQSWTMLPLVLDKDSTCFTKWSVEPGWNQACW